MHKPGGNGLWKNPVEKPVENVENLGFSTAISVFCKKIPAMHKALHKHRRAAGAVALCRRRTLKNFKEKPAKKLDSRQNCPQNPGTVSGKWENFCEKAPKTVLYDFTSRGNT